MKSGKFMIASIDRPAFQPSRSRRCAGKAHSSHLDKPLPPPLPIRRGDSRFFRQLTARWAFALSSTGLIFYIRVIIAGNS